MATSHLSGTITVRHERPEGGSPPPNGRSGWSQSEEVAGNMGRDYLATPSTDLPPPYLPQTTIENLTLNKTGTGKYFRSIQTYKGPSLC